MFSLSIQVLQPHCFDENGGQSLVFTQTRTMRLALISWTRYSFYTYHELADVLFANHYVGLDDEIKDELFKC